MIFGHHPRQGLYDPQFEHDACGVAFVATMTGVASHKIVEQGLEALRNLDHRGATGADPAAGDGAGILVQVPDAFLRRTTGIRLPEPGSYAVGLAFMPVDEAQRARARAAIELIAADEGIKVLGWREVPVHTHTLSEISLGTMPHFEHLLIRARDGRVGMDLEHLAFVLAACPA